MLYLLLKWLHILAVIAAVGANFTYGRWITMARRMPEAMLFALRGIEQIDRRIANPLYGLLLIAGLAMVYVVRMPLATPWLMAGIALYILIVLIGRFIWTPTLRGQIQFLEAEGPGSAGFQALARRGAWLGAILGFIMIAIVYLMVVKPG